MCSGLPRIATSGPLLAEESFAKFWDDVFNDRHALIPDIKNSEEWQTKLVLCQRAVLEVDGRLGGGAASAVKTLSFAKQRFDSMASPQRQFCCLLVPIALLLAYASVDSRQPAAVRSRARRRLVELPGHVITAGLSASYSEAALIFVRHFDVADHDPAETYSERKAFVEKMMVLFVDGRIWEESGDEVGTSLEIAIRQASKAEPIFFGEGEVLHLDRRPPPAELQAASTAIKNITEVMIRRVIAELPLDDLGVLLTCFSLTRWHLAIAAARGKQDSSELDRLREHAKLMFKAWRLSSGPGARALESSAHQLCIEERPALETGSVVDNREAWSRVLRPEWPLQNDVPHLNLAIRIYRVVMDSSCGVERDLGCLTRILEHHQGPLSDSGETVAHLVDVLADGPSDEAGIARQVVSDGACHLEPTELCSDFAKTWIDLHGRRFRVYKTTAARKPGPKHLRKSTHVAVARGTARSLHLLASKGRVAPDESAVVTVVGIPKRMFWGSLSPATPSAATKRFEDLTKTKVARGSALAMARRTTRGNPYAVPLLNPNGSLRCGTCVTGPPRLSVRSLPPNATLAVLDCCASPIAARSGYSIMRPPTVAADFVSQMLKARLVVCDSPWVIDSARKVSDLSLACAFCTIALGKATVSESKWPLFFAGMPANAEVVFFKPVGETLELSLFVPASLRRVLPFFVDVVWATLRVPSVRWKTVAKRGADCRVLGSESDVRVFLHDIRRVDHSGRGKLGGRYVAQAPGAE